MFVSYRIDIMLFNRLARNPKSVEVSKKLLFYRKARFYKNFSRFNKVL